MPMRSFNLKDCTVVSHPANDDSTHPGRTIRPEPMREPGWIAARSGSGGPASTGMRNWTGESVQRRENHVTDEERDAAREWLRHVEAGRIGSRSSSGE